MYILNPFTCNRLKRLPKHPVVWEGDRRPILAGMLENFGYEHDNFDDGDAYDCILWVDGTEGVLRAVSIVPADTGPEAVARTLLQAMEHPQGAMPAGRPHTVLVRDREIQFFLRGALQNLDVNIEHTAKLPIIDEIFDSLHQPTQPAVSPLPADWVSALHREAHRLWDNAPWNTLADHQILSITLNRWELDSVYVSVLGMAGLEYGALFYRSLDSLTQFREAALAVERSTQQMQQAFFSQDCLFLNFELIRDEGSTPLLPLPWMQAAPSAIEPEFGSLHPLEGLRNTLELEEAAALWVCLEGLNRFLEAHERKLARAKFPTLTAQYDVTDPITGEALTITVQTCPDLTQKIEAMEDEVEADQVSDMIVGPRFQDDLVPEGSMVALRCMEVEMVGLLRGMAWYQAEAETPPPEHPFPIIVIQTSRPKAKAIAQQIRDEGGVQGLCFTPGLDPMTGESLQLGLLQTQEKTFHLLIELSKDDPNDRGMIENWQRWQQDFGDRCGLVIASGITGAARGNPGVRETVAFFETRSRSPQDLNLPPLQMTYALDWE